MTSYKFLSVSIVGAIVSCTTRYCWANLAEPKVCEISVMLHPPGLEARHIFGEHIVKIKVIGYIDCYTL